MHAASGGGLRNVQSGTSGNLNVISSARANATEGPRDLIIDGTEFKEGDYPYLAYLYIQSDENASMFGGALIDPNWILTAANCADTALNITAFLGMYNISFLMLKIQTLSSIIFIQMTSDLSRLGFQKAGRRFCIAIYKKRVLNYDIFVPAEKDNVWVSGWENTDYYNPYYSFVPMEISLEVDYYDITNDMLCATARGAGASCQEDSGGPVITKDPNGNHSNDVLVDVVGWSVGCNYAKRPDLYSRVSAALSWLLSM